MDNNQFNPVEIHKLVLRNLAGVEIDLRNIFIDLNIFENIFTPFKTGTILLKDTNDLINIFPIVGGEELELYFTSEGDNEHQKAKVQTFIIYNVAPDKNVQTGSEVKSLVQLLFCSPEMIISEKEKICKRFSSTTEDVIEYLLRTVFKSKKDLFFETPDNRLSFVANFWTPTKIIKYFQSNSKGNFNDFMFFENMNGFNFKSLSQLMIEDNSHTILFEDSQEMLYRNDVTKGKIITKYFNDIEAFKFGSYGNTFFELYQDKYGFNKYETDFVSMTQFNTSLGKNVQHRDDLINNNNINLTELDGAHLSRRNVIIKALSNYQLIITLNGDTTKTSGQIYDFKINKKLKESADPNLALTGKWFATHINHQLQTDNTYTQNIKMVKNAFNYFNDFENTEGRQNL